MKNTKELIGNNEEMQKNMDSMLVATRKAIKKHFPAYAKMIQADVTAEILHNAGDDVTMAQMKEAMRLLNEVMIEQGKNIEKTVEQNISERKKEMASWK